MWGAKMNPTIPKTDSIEELARFWDTHDLTEFEDPLDEVTEPLFEAQGRSDLCTAESSHGNPDQEVGR